MKQKIITGNIGTGKSTVTKIFEENRYKVISIDVISSEILETNHKKVSKLFSIRPQKFIGFKKELGNMVFQYPKIKKQLEDFMIPLIKKEIDAQSLVFSESDIKYVFETLLFLK